MAFLKSGTIFYSFFYLLNRIYMRYFKIFGEGMNELRWYNYMCTHANPSKSVSFFIKTPLVNSTPIPSVEICWASMYCYIIHKPGTDDTLRESLHFRFAQAPSLNSPTNGLPALVLWWLQNVKSMLLFPVSLPPFSLRPPIWAAVLAVSRRCSGVLRVLSSPGTL